MKNKEFVISQYPNAFLAQEGAPGYWDINIDSAHGLVDNELSEEAAWSEAARTIMETYGVEVKVRLMLNPDMDKLDGLAKAGHSLSELGQDVAGRIVVEAMQRLFQQGTGEDFEVTRCEVVYPNGDIYLAEGA